MNALLDEARRQIARDALQTVSGRSRARPSAQSGGPGVGSAHSGVASAAANSSTGGNNTTLRAGSYDANDSNLQPSDDDTWG